MDFVRVHADDLLYYSVTDTIRRFNDCVVPIIGDSIVDTNSIVDSILSDEVFTLGGARKYTTPAEPIENMELQPCYKNAEDELGVDEDRIADGLFVKYAGTIMKVIGFNGPMLRCIIVDSSDADEIEIRWDNVTVLNNDDAVNHDYITCDPIFEGANTVEIYGYDRYGRTQMLGEVYRCNYDEDRFVRCEDCGRVFDSESDRYYSLMHSDDYTNVCSDCYDDGWTTCEDCGSIIRLDYAYCDDDDGYYYCEECWNNNGHGRSGAMHDYSYKPRGMFHPSFVQSGLYYGVELEVDKGRNVRECCDDLAEVSDSEDLFYLKHDGSLNDGIEIVTHPCTLDYQLSEFPWDDVCRIATEHGFKSHDAGTCGLHVHISRAGLGENKDLQDLHIAKMILWVDRYWDELVNFSRRNYNQLDRWAKKPDAKIYSYDTQDTAVDKAKRSGERDRYKAVNLTNSNTVEFRLFRGSLKVQTIKATMQFLANLVGYTAEHSLEDVQDAKWTDITRYKEYPELVAYLAERNLTEVADKPKPVEPKPVKVRFKNNDIVWFATENTDNRPVRGTVSSVHIDEEDTQQPLYIVEDEEGHVNFLVDDEIMSDDDIVRLEAARGVTAVGVA